MIIFDCNGVLVDSEQIAAAAAADEFARAGISITPELVTRYFSGRRPAQYDACLVLHRTAVPGRAQAQALLEIIVKPADGETGHGPVQLLPSIIAGDCTAINAIILLAILYLIDPTHLENY